MNEFLDAAYTPTGMASVCTLAALGGIFAVGTVVGLTNLHKKLLAL